MGSRPPPLTTAEEVKIRKLAEQGVTRANLAARFGVSRSLIHRVLGPASERAKVKEPQT